MKKALAVLLAIFMLVALVACGGEEAPESEEETAEMEQEETMEAEETPAEEDVEEEPEVAESSEPVTIKIGVPTAPPALPLLHMIEDNVLGDDVILDMNIWTGPEQLIAMVQDGTHDMFAFPLTVIAKLSNKGVPVKLMNVNTWGVTYFLTSDSEFESWADLKGKTVYIPLQSSPPDALTQYFINEAGLKVGEDVQIVYASMVEVASLLASGEAEYATLIEPQVTVALSKNENVRRALSFEEEWQRTTGTDTMIPNAGWGAMAPFIENNPELTERFQEAYEESVQWVLDNPAEAAALAETYLDMPAAVVEKAIPNMGLHFKAAADAEFELNEFYNLLNDFDPSMIGGQLPDASMFYTHE